MIPPWPEEAAATFEEYVATPERLCPALARIWNDAVHEQTRNTVTTMPEGKVRDKMSDQVGTRINEILGSYSPEFSRIQTPVPSFFSIRDGSDYSSSEYMSQEQKAEVLHFFAAVLQPLQRTQIEAFKRQLPTVRVVELLAGHHDCFIRHEDAVAHEIMPFLLPDHLPRPVSG